MLGFSNPWVWVWGGGLLKYRAESHWSCLWMWLGRLEESQLQAFGDTVVFTGWPACEHVVLSWV